MIAINSVTKKFGDVVALNSMSCEIASGSIFGLVGSNGAGKSTLLRILSGVFEATSGNVKIDGENNFENQNVKSRTFFIPDYPYFFNNSTIDNTASLYRKIYPNWNEEKFLILCGMFPIPRRKKIINMSKGMQRQAALILGLSTQPKYLFLDEIFDGLDPVVRQLLKKLLAQDVTENNMTVVIASHNLRELEDVCDHVGLLHRGGVILEKELDELKLGIHKVQIAFQSPPPEGCFNGLNLVNLDQKGNLFNLTIRGNEEEIRLALEKLNPVFLESLPLTLEEVFISEMEVAGYDINNIIG